VQPLEDVASDDTAGAHPAVLAAIVAHVRSAVVHA
jgi:hypothetical protein